MQSYVVGFLFNSDQTEVVLIRKEKPAWQKGKLNGVGGKIEPGETPMEAMVREFTEEAGLTVTNWREYCTISDNNHFKIHFFFANHASSIYEVESKTEEKVGVFSVNELPYGACLPNIYWEIPMALSMTRGERAKSFTIIENT